MQKSIHGVDAEFILHCIHTMPSLELRQASSALLASNTRTGVVSFNLPLDGKDLVQLCVAMRTDLPGTSLKLVTNGDVVLDMPGLYTAPTGMGVVAFPPDAQGDSRVLRLRKWLALHPAWQARRVYICFPPGRVRVVQAIRFLVVTMVQQMEWTSRKAELAVVLNNGKQARLRLKFERAMCYRKVDRRSAERLMAAMDVRRRTPAASSLKSGSATGPDSTGVVSARQRRDPSGDWGITLSRMADTSTLEDELGTMLEEAASRKFG